MVEKGNLVRMARFWKKRDGSGSGEESEREWRIRNDETNWQRLQMSSEEPGRRTNEGRNFLSLSHHSAAQGPEEQRRRGGDFCRWLAHEIGGNLLLN